MTARLTVLASGSAGNATLLEVNGFGLLIDCGLHPRLLGARLAEVGAPWDSVPAGLLTPALIPTHTPPAHGKDLPLPHLRSPHTPPSPPPPHLEFLNAPAPSFDSLHRAALTRTYQEGQVLELVRGLICRPVRVSHDSDPT